MLTFQQAYYSLKDKLTAIYEVREADAIAHELVNAITGYNKTERLMRKDQAFTIQQQVGFELACAELLQGKPLQYVTGKAWFMGSEYMVNEAVLIPRPETEELVQWVIDDWKGRDKRISILDIGTGSGCIPVSLKLAMAQAEVFSCDISTAALDVARQNAGSLGAGIHLLQADVLDENQRNKLPSCEVIISNPPYIPQSEHRNMHVNVVNYEPALALFVPDNDPLVFYSAIAGIGKKHLQGKGYIYCELDAAHAAACGELFEQSGYAGVEIRKDMHGNWRLLRAQLQH